MKPALLALLVLAGSAHAATDCTGSVKQITVDIGGNARVFVMLTNGAGFDMPESGDTWKVVLSMAQGSKMTGAPLTLTYAASVNCAGAGYRTDLVRVSTPEEGSGVR